jgi:hypothetical protein
MKILHYIPSTELKDGILPIYMSKLLQALGTKAEVHILTTKSNQSIEFKGATIHYIDKVSLSANHTPLCTMSKFLNILYKVFPDIVHIHGCWDYTASRIEEWIRHRGFPVVYSPHGGLNPQIIKLEFWKEKLPKILLYQFKTIRNADVIHVTSKEEYDNMMDLGWRKRIVVVGNPMLDGSLTPDVLAMQMISLYTKVIDSDVHSHLNKNEWEAISALLHVGISNDKNLIHLMPMSIVNLRNLKYSSWKNIFMYSYDEDIQGIIKNGIELMQLNVPNIVIKDEDRFKQKNAKPKGSLTCDKLILKNLRYNHVAGDDSSQEIMICRMFLNIKYLSRKKKLTLHHLSDLCFNIKYTDYDEDHLKKLLEKLRIRRFASRIIQILSETHLLEEGFMPINPIDDGTTERIRTMIT